MTTLPVKHKLLLVQVPSVQRPDDERPEAVFARRAREIREAQGLTQSHIALQLEAAARIKLDPSAITKIEKGARAIRLDEAAAIASALDMTIDEILRPALPVEQQVEQARTAIERAEWRAAAALAEFEVAKARLRRLQDFVRNGDEHPGEEDDHGEHQEAT